MWITILEIRDIDKLLEDVMFDWTAEISGTGDRSEFKLETVLDSII